MRAASLLTSDPRVQAVSFVGSSAVAEHIYTTASAPMAKRITGLRGRQKSRNRHAGCRLRRHRQRHLWAEHLVRRRTLYGAAGSGRGGR